MGESKTRGGCRAGGATSASHGATRWVGGEGPTSSLYLFFLSACPVETKGRQGCPFSIRVGHTNKLKPREEREDSAVLSPLWNLVPVSHDCSWLQALARLHKQTWHYPALPQQSHLSSHHPKRIPDHRLGHGNG